MAKGSAEIGPAGSFTLEIDVPAGASTGTGWIGLDENQAWGTGHELTIAEYRRPDFEVTTSAGSGPYRRGESIAATAQADYYTGGPLGDAPVTWQVTTSEATYAPPGWDHFDFGRWIPWWSEDLFIDEFAPSEYEPCCFEDEEKVETFTGRTDAAGAHHLDLRVGDLDADVDGLPVTVRANAAVQDVNRQVIAGTTDLLVHPADLYVGLGGSDTFVRQGEDLTIDVIVTDIDGVAVAGRQVDVVAGRTTGRFVDGEWTDELLDTTTCTVTSATEPAPCTLTPPAGGTYRITATVTDDAGRVSRSETTRWVSGAEAIPSRTVGREALTVVPDAEEYRPGQTAQLLVQAPFATGTGLIVTDRGPVTSTATFELVDGSAIVPVAVGDDDVPNINVSIEVAGSTPRTAADGAIVEGAPDAAGLRHRHGDAARVDRQPDARRHRDPGRRPAHARRRDDTRRPGRRTRRRTGRRGRPARHGRRRGGPRPQRVRARRPGIVVLRRPADRDRSAVRPRRHRARRSRRPPRRHRGRRRRRRLRRGDRDDGRGRHDRGRRRGGSSRRPTWPTTEAAADADRSSAQVSDPVAVRSNFECSRSLRPRRHDGRRRPRRRRPPAPRQPHPLPRDGRRRRRYPAVRHRRGQRDRRAAADGPPDRTPLPELRRPRRAAGRRPEQPQRAARRRCRRGVGQPRRRRPGRRAGHRPRQRPGRGALPHRRRGGRPRRPAGQRGQRRRGPTRPR